MQEPADLIGQRFGRLVVTKYLGKRVFYNNKSNSHAYECKCDCGKKKVIPGYVLKTGKSNSCGCLQSELTIKRNTKHNDSKTKLYYVWKGMKQRCNNPKCASYHNYGARGIKVEFESYEQFKEWALKNGYKQDAGLSIERIDVNKGYSAENCCWTNNKQQENNRRNNAYYTIDGVTHTLTQWCEIYGAPYKRVEARLTSLGWDIKDALTKERCIYDFTLTLNGETKSLNEWSEITNLPRRIIRNRKKSGWSDEEILTIPLLKKGDKNGRDKESRISNE